MFARVVRSEREFKNLMMTDGSSCKAICVSDKHHVAWCFPTLVPLSGNVPEPLIVGSYLLLQ